MNKVTTINLNGRAYQVEEAGYDALRKYLDDARAQLKDDPDLTEVMADFEQAIADKCDARMAPRKNVVTAAEIEEIIKAMGPVDAGAHSSTAAENESADGNGGATTGSGTSGPSENKSAAPKRLYRIREGAMFRGVCTGLAAYFNLDVTLVRVLFVVLALITHGALILLYLVLMFVIPVARNADEVAEAHGEQPFTAQDFIDRAKAEYQKFAEDPTMNKDEWRAKMKAWKKEMKAKRHEWKNEWRAQRHDYSHDDWHGGGAGAIIGGIIVAVLWIAFIYSIWSFLVYGMIFGHVIGVGHPLWVTLAFMVLIFWLILLPFKALTWSSRCHDDWHGHHGHHHGGPDGGLWTLAILVLLFYIASLLFPPVHMAWDHVITYLRTVR